MFSPARSPVTLLMDVVAGVVLLKRTTRLALVTANVSPLPRPGWGFGGGVSPLLPPPPPPLQPTSGSVKRRYRVSWARELGVMGRLFVAMCDYRRLRRPVSGGCNRVHRTGSRALEAIVCFQE